MHALWTRLRTSRLKFLVGLGVVAALVVAVPGLAGTSDLAEFEAEDGNLVDDGTPSSVGGIDWNAFAPTTWTGTAPYRTSEKSHEGWAFNGLEDAQAVTSDTAFAGGTKQDNDCATVGTQKADNKADLKRIYMASKTLANGHVVLNLGWVRIPQNTTSPSAHVAFEFNQNETACSGPNHGGLVPRSTANGGDLLVLYDFEGGSEAPVISISRWTASGWSAPDELTSGEAEARVNTQGAVTDKIGPNGDDPGDSLGTKEFGEAGIDLTDAGVFPATSTSCLSFGNAFGVTRTSGNSNTAQMKDLVGPGEISLSNCGTVTIRKQTLPDGDTTTEFGYTTDVQTLPASTTSPFKLKDDGSNTIQSVKSGSYDVTEDDPGPGYALTDIDCSASNTATTPTEDEGSRKASFTVGAGESVDCTFTNTKQKGALRILKKSTKTGNPLVKNAGAVFTYDSSEVIDNGTGDKDNDVGEVCVDGLAPGQYSVKEKTPPSGYGGDSDTETATVVSGNDCAGDNDPAIPELTFTNPPLADIQVRFRDGGSGETKLVDGKPLDCDNTSGSESTADTTGWDDTLTILGVKAPQKVTCTIEIDP